MRKTNLCLLERYWIICMVNEKSIMRNLFYMMFLTISQGIFIVGSCFCFAMFVRGLENDIPYTMNFLYGIIIQLELIMIFGIEYIRIDKVLHPNG